MPTCSSSVVRARRSLREVAVMIHYQDRWAVVTGASSGLGRGLAARLARPGHVAGADGPQRGPVGGGGARDSPRCSPGEGRDGRRRPLDPVRCVRAARSRRRPPDRGAGQQRRVWQLRPICRGRSRTGRPTRWPSTSAPSSRWLERSCPECSPEAAAGFSTSRPRSPSSPRPTRRCTERARHSCCRSAQALWAEARGGRRGGHRAVSRSHPHRFRRRAWRRRRPHGDLQPARRA